MTISKTDQLAASLGTYGPLAVAVSGGVDSMTLAHAAHNSGIADVEVFHAVSAAVPEVATERVRTHARTHNWRLSIVDAGEMTDPAYLANPADRCRYCKTDLYRTIRDRTDSTIASGTNVDDLSDYRPGLEAAAAAGVVHPFVDLGMDKGAVRRLASVLDLDDLAELPASPCLSSRVETGLRIEPATLRAIDRVELELRSMLGQGTIRCRLRRSGVFVELAEDVLTGLTQESRSAIREAVTRLWAGGEECPTVEIGPYRRGSAFLRVNGN